MRAAWQPRRRPRNIHAAPRGGAATRPRWSRVVGYRTDDPVPGGARDPGPGARAAAGARDPVLAAPRGGPRLRLLGAGLRPRPPPDRGDPAAAALRERLAKLEAVALDLQRLRLEEKLGEARAAARAWQMGGAAAVPGAPAAVGAPVVPHSLHYR